MKRFVFYLTSILLLIIFNNVVNCYFHDYHLSTLLNHQYPFQWVYDLKTNPKVVFIGSSTTKTGYSIKLIQDSLGLQDGEVINLATMPNNPEITYFILSQYINKLKGAKIVYGIDPWIMGEEYYQNFNYKLSQMTIEQRFNCLRNGGVGFGQFINILNGGNLINNIQVYLFRSKDFSQNNFGEQSWKGENSKVIKNAKQRVPHIDYTISQDFLKSINEIDRLCHINNCKIIAYIPSYSKSWLEEYKKTGYNTLLKPKLDRNLHFANKLFSLNSLPDSLFYDRIHVNNEGKLIKSRQMIDMINQF